MRFFEPGNLGTFGPGKVSYRSTALCRTVWKRQWHFWRGKTDHTAMASDGSFTGLKGGSTHSLEHSRYSEPGGTMPFVNIRLVEGRSQQRKDEISKRVTAAISEVLQLPKDDIWVVFEDVPAGDWYVGSTTVAELRNKAQK
jgi:4-oxalocrotonate tautomerase